MKPNDTPPPADDPKANNAAGAGCMARLVVGSSDTSVVDTLVAELVCQRGDMKLCYDDRDGWFVQFLYSHSLPDSWTTIDRHEERHGSPTRAIMAARQAHNDDAEYQRKSGNYAIYKIIPDNSGVSRVPEREDR